MPRKPRDAPAGMAWCSAHQEFHPVADFQRDQSRKNGLAGNCRTWRRAHQRVYDAHRQATAGAELNRKRSARRGRAGEAEKKRRRRAFLAQVRTVEPLRRERLRLGLVPGHRVACIYCGGPVEQPGDQVVNGAVLTRPLAPDHVIPLSRGGHNVPGNLVPACSRCNSSKAQKFIAEWKWHRRCIGAAPTRGGLLAGPPPRPAHLP